MLAPCESVVPHVDDQSVTVKTGFAEIGEQVPYGPVHAADAFAVFPDFLVQIQSAVVAEIHSVPALTLLLHPVGHTVFTVPVLAGSGLASILYGRKLGLPVVRGHERCGTRIIHVRILVFIFRRSLERIVDVLVGEVNEERAVLVALDEIDRMGGHKVGDIFIISEFGPLTVYVQTDIVICSLPVQTFPTVESRKRHPVPVAHVQFSEESRCIAG